MTDFDECLTVDCDFQPCQKHFFGKSVYCHAHVRPCNRQRFGVENFFFSSLFDGETPEQKDARFALL